MSEDDSSSRSAVGKFQFKMLILAVFCTLAGLAAVGWTWINQPPAPTEVIAPDGSSGFIDRDAASAKIQELSDSWTHWFGTRGIKLGVSFLGGFALGFAFRTFVKTMAVLSALVVVAVVLLSYFNVLNIDMTQVQDKWDTHSEWITDQAVKLKDFIWAYLPSSTAVFVGFFVGMIRK